MGNPDNPPVIFLHGGGQTRGSWKASLEAVAALGFHAVAFDARGHGESSLSADRDYSLVSFADDLEAVIGTTAGRPILIGASLGGLTSLIYAGRVAARPIRGLVLVDVSLRSNPEERQRIFKFMSSGKNGFFSLDEAAEALREYNPNRQKPVNTRGLTRVLRKRNERFFWHWDPAFLDYRMLHDHAEEALLEEAASRISAPSLLVHAGRSGLVGEQELTHLRSFLPACGYARVEDAGHMVAGDANDQFNSAIVNFIHSIGNR